jgi:hypothetical protein
VHLVFSSLRSIRPGCCMPSDSFMHSGFRFLLRFFSLAGKELLHCRGRYFPPSQKFGCLSRALNDKIYPFSPEVRIGCPTRDPQNPNETLSPVARV